MFEKVYDLNLYKIFYVCANCKSFTEASNKLNLTQPAVSYGVKTLESQLGVKLFDRTNNGIKLTHEGNALLYYVEKANNSLTSASKIINELLDKKITEINIGVPTHVGAYYFIDFLKIFKEKHPDIKVNIVDKKTSEMLKMIDNKELDILLDTDLIESKDKNIKIIKLKDFTGIFVGNSKYKNISEKGKISVKEFEKLPIILPSETTTTRKLIDSYFRRKNVLIKPIIETNSSPIAKTIIETGIGIGWMISDFVEEEIKNKKMFEVKTDIENVKIPISIIYQENNLNYAIKDLIKIFKENVK